MQLLLRPLLLTLLSLALLTLTAQTQAARIGFGNTWADYSSYTEAGFVIDTNTGSVRVNNAFAPFDYAAHPSAGFTSTSWMTLEATDQALFNLVSLELLEATSSPAPYSLIIRGIYADDSTVSQTLTLDGVAGSQLFTLAESFTTLKRVEFLANPSNAYATENVQLDNIQVRRSAPEPGTALGSLLLLTALIAGRRRRQRTPV